MEKHLAPPRRDHHLRIWSDQSLLEGEPWLARSRQELATAKVSILLIGANFGAGRKFGLHFNWSNRPSRLYGGFE